MSNREWESEPNRRAWIAHGLECRIVRQDNLKHLCGYVGVPAGHPAFKQDYDSVEIIDPEYCPHGGLTYGSDHAPHEKPDGRWWLGFDCAHLGDLVPGISTDRNNPENHYRNMAYVEAETEKLAEQLSLAAAKGEAP